MAYVNFSPESGSTLTADERAAEAERILRRFKDCDLDQMENGGVLTTNASGFLADKLDELETFGRVAVSVNQLFWLRDLAEKLP